MANDYLTRGAVVALVVLTVLGMTAAPAMANSTPNHGNGDDCDLVDVDGDNNNVSVDMQNSDVNINCGDDGAAGGGGDDAGDTADEDMNVQVNGDEVDTNGQNGADGQDGDDGADGQDGQDGADGQDGQDGADGQDGDDGADGQDGDDGADGQDGQNGDDGQDGQDGADGQDGQDGDDGQDADTGDSDNEQNIGDVDNSTILQFLLDLDFIDQSEVNAAINNENISNSTIVNNIVNGDQTINLSSVYIDDRDTNIDNSTTIVVYNNGTINIINEDGPGDVETPPGDDDGNETPPGDGDMNETAPDINVTKTSGMSAVNVTFNETAGVLQAEDPAQFTVTVTNEGNATANNVVVNDDDVVADIEGIPNETTAFLVLSSSTSQGDFNAVSGDFEVGTLAPGESATLTFDALAVSTNLQLLEDEVTSVNATNDATLENVSPEDPNGANDRGNATVQLLGLLDIPDLPGPGTDTPAPSPSPSPVAGGASPAIASGGIPLSGMAVGTMGVVGLLGSVLVFRRKDE